MSEKLFKIQVYKGEFEGKPLYTELNLPENKLEAKHIDLFLGELLRRWDDSPEKVQMKFMKMLSDACHKKPVPERFKNVFPSDIEYFEKDLIQPNRERKDRCCGRCDGVNDLCVTDMVCEEHKTMGCYICWPEPEQEKIKV